MSVITSLSLTDGDSVHIAAQVLDQYGNVMPGLMANITDPGPNTSFVSDIGTTASGNVIGNSLGTDTLIATYLVLTASLPVVVTPAASVPTSIQWTSP